MKAHQGFVVQQPCVVRRQAEPIGDIPAEVADVLTGVDVEADKP
jgi:hypothetical protein